ncbi:pV [red squirrel adenovirus 1]|uniref:PV n=1 Tax=red squirrel adenovirus 1 TaxID=2773314 RepID=A0A220A473_9ADEN|nr:pV [red squirrel adenovirus 1]ARE31886.1 pV [red squirrel adenovirus 1]WUG45427.1 V [Squirrel mastadenovirus A] [Squirrel mastadenovirus A]
MTSAAVSRLIKEELLTSAYPEHYSSSTLARPIRRVVPKQERKIKILPKSETVKVEIKKSDRKRRSGLQYDDEVEFVRTFAPRRPYQWKGRKVKRVLRPGTVVTFTPGERTGVRSKRGYDEVYADEDILQQAAELTGEFAYGKRRRTGEALVLDTKNETPSLVPITPQTVLPIAGIKRAHGAELKPTVQVMVPAKRTRNHNSYPATETITVKEEDMMDVGPSSLFVKSESPETKMEIEDIKIRPIKQVTPEIGIQTVDIKVPVSREVQTDLSDIATATPPSTKGRPTLPQGVRYHPSITFGPKVVRTRRRRRRRRAAESRRRWRMPAVTSKGVQLPRVTYHPSIVV